MKISHYILFTMLISCGSTKVISNNNGSIVEIYFNDFFRSEKVSLKLCNCEVFKDVSMNSNEVGYSRVNVKGFLDNGFIFHYNNKTFPCKLCKSDNLQIEVIINNLKKIFVIDTKKGKYIGFDKNKDGVKLTQQSKPFEYE